MAASESDNEAGGSSLPDEIPLSGSEHGIDDMPDEIPLSPEGEAATELGGDEFPKCDPCSGR